jgi:hypothetical protein
MFIAPTMVRVRLPLVKRRSMSLISLREKKNEGGRRRGREGREEGCREEGG